METKLITVLEVLGTFSFALSGIRMASGKQIDWFGAYIIGLVTSIGGGTLRDLLLQVRPFWMLDVKYFLTTGFALFAFLVFKEKILKWGNTLFLFDTVGLGLFTIVGINKSLQAGLPFWVCIVMGTITGTFGGVVRDVLINQVPLVFRKEVYALACVAGGLIYWCCIQLDISEELNEIIAAVSVIIIRFLAVRFQIHLPQLKAIDKSKET